MSKTNSNPKMIVVTVLMTIATILLVCLAVLVYLYTSKGTEDIANKELRTISTEDEEDEFTEELDYLYNIIPGFTWQLVDAYPYLYINIVENKMDNSIDVYGFAYNVDGSWNTDMEFIDHLVFDANYSMYSSGSFDIFIDDDYIMVADNREHESGDFAFQGDFSLVQDTVKLEQDEILSFFRETSNVGKRFKCNLSYYDSFYIYDDEFDSYIHLYLLKYIDKDGREIIFEVILPPVSQTFFEHDTVTLTGIYSYWASEFGYGEILIDGIDIEFYERK